MTKPIKISLHAHQRMKKRGTTEEEVIETIRTGELTPAKKGRVAYRKNFQYNSILGKIL